MCHNIDFAINNRDTITIIIDDHLRHTLIFGVINNICVWLPVNYNICNKFSISDCHGNEYDDDIIFSNSFFFSYRVYHLEFPENRDALDFLDGRDNSNVHRVFDADEYGHVFTEFHVDRITVSRLYWHCESFAHCDAVGNHNAFSHIHGERHDQFDLNQYVYGLCVGNVDDLKHWYSDDVFVRIAVPHVFCGSFVHIVSHEYHFELAYNIQLSERHRDFHDECVVDLDSVLGRFFYRCWDRHHIAHDISVRCLYDPLEPGDAICAAKHCHGIGFADRVNRLFQWHSFAFFVVLADGDRVVFSDSV